MGTTPWLPTIGYNSKPRIRLFCLPFAGGMSSIFRTWQKQLPDSVEVCPIELPGRGARLSEPRFKRLHPLAEAIVAGITPYLDSPFSLFGHSMGALLSYEIARQLTHGSNMNPVQLFVAGHDAPQVTNHNGAKYALSDMDLLKYLKSLQGSPDAALDDAELMKLMLPIIRADLEVSDTYVYKEGQPLTCPIYAFGGESDSETTPSGLSAWQHQTRSLFSLKMIAGGHFFLNTSRPLLLQEIRRVIAA